MALSLSLGDTRAIVDACKKYGISLKQAAYVLATAYHESAHKMKPIREMGGEKYLKSKEYYPYVGMGLVQLTWRANYEDWSRRTGVDFVANPKLLLKSEYAVRILVEGMKLGTFTKKKLSDYITDKKTDYRGARRIINGTDRAADIAKLANEYEKLLAASGYGVEPKPKSEPKETNINNMALTIGNRGPHVITLQQQLTTLGYWDAPNNGIFDNKLKTAVEAFQTDHKDKDGQPLLVDGKAGNRTSAAIGAALEAKETKPKMAAAKKVVNDAASEGKVISRTEKAALLGGFGSIGGVAAAVEEGRNVVDSASSIWETVLHFGPWVIACVALGAFAYIFWDRRNKRLDARQAQEVIEE